MLRKNSLSGKQHDLDLRLKFVIMAMSAALVNSDRCPGYNLDQQPVRIERGTLLDVNITLPGDLSYVSWHTSPTLCLKEPQEVASCNVDEPHSPVCSNFISGHHAWIRAIGLNFSSLAKSPNQTPTSFILSLEITNADTSISSLGTSVTYTTKDGINMTLKAFRPHLIYTTAKRFDHVCRPITIVGGHRYWFHQLIVGEVSPEMECRLIGRPEIVFHYQYLPFTDGIGRLSQHGRCSCLLPITGWSDEQSVAMETQLFQVRAKTKGISSIYINDLDIQRARPAHAENFNLQPDYLEEEGDVEDMQPMTISAPSYNVHNEEQLRGVDLRHPHKVQDEDEDITLLETQDGKLPMPLPRLRPFFYFDLDSGQEPDAWHDVVVDFGLCYKPCNDTGPVYRGASETSLITIDQTTCPYYLEDGSVARCRCHLAGGSKFYPDGALLVKWSSHTSKVTLGYDWAAVLVHKYRGKPTSYICMAVDAETNRTLETIKYSPQDIHHRYEAIASSLREHLYMVFVVIVINLGVFVGSCIYMMQKKNNATYISEVVSYTQNFEDEMTQRRNSSKPSITLEFDHRTTISSDTVID